ncbi:MAG TPA: hypothetical protein VFV96_04845 [Verrucomicrobiae bacterium]|nr:hypothetical protein [Verrucomicrobiae bacterium]
MATTEAIATIAIKLALMTLMRVMPVDVQAQQVQKSGGCDHDDQEETVPLLSHAGKMFWRWAGTFPVAIESLRHVPRNVP